MIFAETRLRGAYLIDPERKTDERGYFARVFCSREFEAHGLRLRWVQANVSHNARRGTLRGLHYQKAPCGEKKLVRCTRGAIYDVILDLRAGSPTFGQWVGVELSAENGRMLLVPEGAAHGFITLAADTDVFYHVSQFYRPEAEGGVRYDDPAFAIRWPVPVEAISAKDRSWPDFDPARPTGAGEWR